MDTFNDITPEEAKLLTAQFLGESILGEFKQLDSNIVSGLARVELDPYKILNTIPSALPVAQQPVVQQPAPQFVAQQPAPQFVQQPQTIIPAPVIATDQNQLELNFNSSPYTVTIFERLEKIEKTLQSILTLQADILDALPKKKDKKIA